MSDLVQRQTALSAYVIQFCRYLRKRNFTITAQEEADALEGLALFPPISKERFINVLRATLSKDSFEYRGFEEIFETFESERQRAVDSKEKKLLEKKSVAAQSSSLQELKNWLFHHETSEVVHTASYSNQERLSQKDFALMDEQEIRAMLGLLRQLSKKILRRKSRLKRGVARGGQIDLRRTLQKNFRKGTDIEILMRSERKERKLNLVLISDVSRSMDLYSRFLVQMLYLYQNAYDKIRTFVFSTALHEVSAILDNYDYHEAFEIISERIPHWSGGTKIGSCLNDFVTDYGHGALNKKTIVLILSDGWDRGNPELIESSMRRIKKSSRKVYWLNPLMGNADFKPEAQGLQKAMPFIHKMLPVHNLESLLAVLKGL